MAQGTDVKVARQRGSVWNTAVSANVVMAGWAVNSWPLGNGLGDLIYSNALTGGGFRANAIRGLAKITGDAPADLRYTGFEHDIAMAMGIAGVPTMSDTTAQTHVFQLATNLDGLFDTMVVELVGTTIAPWEWPSVKHGGFVVTMTADGLSTIAFPLYASSCKPLTGQVNTTLAAVTYRSKVLNVFGTHLKFRANTASDIALTDAHRFYPSQITFTYRRNIDSAWVMDGSGVAPEPYFQDFPEVTMDINFPVYGIVSVLHANNTFLTNALAETPMKMDITMLSPVLAGAATAKYSHLIEMPNVVIGNVQMPIEGPGPIPQNVTMACLEAASAPPGMVGLTKLFRWTSVSQMSTNALLNP